MPLAEVAPVYSIAQSARGRGVGGTSRLGALLGLGLMLGDIPRVGPLQRGRISVRRQNADPGREILHAPESRDAATRIVHPYRPYIR